jgi:DNA-directed RNA polymerase subunit beta
MQNSQFRMRPIPLGKQVRMSYALTDEMFDIPNLIEVQKNSYKWFLEEGLREVFQDISPITGFNGNLILEFVDFSLDSKPKYDVEEAKERDSNYSAALKVKARLHNKETGETIDSDVFMGDFPLMTENGTFIINGAERVIVSQLVRSPGIYYGIEYDKTGKRLFSATVIPNRGAWLEYETDSNDIFYVRVDRTRKVPVTVLLRALGVGSDAEILEMFGEEPKILETIEKDATKSYEEGLLEIYKRIRPGEPPTVESAQSLLNNMFFDPRRYDLAKVGRYKFNKKLALRNRVTGFTLAEDVTNAFTGEVVATAGERITLQMADDIQNTGNGYVLVEVPDVDFPVKVLTNQTVDLHAFLGLTSEETGIKDTVFFPVLQEILETTDLEDKALLIKTIKERASELVPKHITLQDILASINYNIHLEYQIGHKDDIDHLGNRRIRAVGELLQNQFRIGLARMERVVRERMTVQDQEVLSPQAFINIRPVTAAIKEFFGSSQLSQFMDQNNPLAELTHKRRLSALGPGGLSRERAGFEVRDVHYSHYGRMCPIETPEGPNIGLINSLATFARINEYGFIEAPYRIIDHSGEKPRVTEEVRYFTADEEENYTVCQATEALNEKKEIIGDKVTARRREEILEFPAEEVNLMDISPKQIVSVATAMIPFLENDDANRALMGANMQRQAVPLIRTNSPIVGTGMEYKAACDSGVLAIAKEDGVAEKVTSDEIVIRGDDGKKHIYKLIKFTGSNQGTCINQRPIINKGDIIKKGDVLADGPSTDHGELALGQNPLIGFMTWEGYNYEDAILLSERLVKEDIYTSVHIEEYEVESRDTKVGPEEITRDIPNVGDDALKDLDERGIIRIGAEVRSGDILVGRVTPKGETELTAEERLLRAIFGEKVREVRDTSLRVPHGEAGIIVDVKVFTRENGDELAPGVNKMVRCYIAQKRKISVGDKMAGRHGNKGVISRVLPVEDMPFLPNGRALDIVLNPLGVPSRMNIGQVLEVHLGLAAKALGFKIATPVFDGANEYDIMRTLEMANDYVNTSWEDFTAKWKETIDEGLYNYLAENLDHRAEWAGVPIDHTGKIELRDGRTGEAFDNSVTVGYMHYLKLHHLVDDKMHARSTGPYATITQQPLGGKAQFGGQRFGEMEVWALEAYGAAYTLQEILTIKSDDVVGRVKTYEAIVKGENIPEPGIPESFKVLLKELQSLALDVRVLNENNTELEIKESVEEVVDVPVNIEGLEDVVAKETFIDEDIELQETDLDDENSLEFDFDGVEEEDEDDLFKPAPLDDLDLE